MAKVTIALSDEQGGLLICFYSDENIPENGFSLAESLGEFALELIKKEFEQITGKNFDRIVFQ